MDQLREGIGLRAYGQKNPLIEYNNEAFNSFKLMFEEIQRCMLYYSLNNAINYQKKIMSKNTLNGSRRKVIKTSGFRARLATKS